MQWNLEQDKWGFDKEFVVNLGPCKRGIKRAKFDLRTHEEVESYLRKVGFTKRRFLRVSKTLFDPLGLLTPIHQDFNMLFWEILLYHPGHYKWDMHFKAEFIPPSAR